MAMEICFVYQDRVQSGAARPGDVNVQKVADVDRGLPNAARSRKREIEEPTVGLLHAFDVRIEDDVEERGQAETVEKGVQRSIRVRHDDDPVAVATKLLHRGNDEGRNDLPQVVDAVILAHFVECRSGAIGNLDAGMLEHEIEERHRAPLVCRCSDDVRLVEREAGEWIGSSQLSRVDDDTVTPKRVRDTRPVRPYQHAAGVQKNGLDRLHGDKVSLIR